MGVGARGARAALLLGALQVLAALGTAVGEAGTRGSSNETTSVPPLNSSANPTESVIQHVTSNQTSESNSSTSNSSTTSASVVPSKVTVTVKPTTTSKMTTPGVSTSMTSTALNSTPKATSVSPNMTQKSTSLTTTAHSTLLTSLTITATVHSQESKGSKFDTGSFVGGIVLTLGVLSILYVGCRVYYSRRGIRYRSIDEHDAII